MDYMGDIAIGVAAVSLAAKLFCIFTPTPAPGTKLGKVYAFVEKIALIVGKVKDTGLVPANATAARIDGITALVPPSLHV